jgi:DNA recombination protein RmuC
MSLETILLIIISLAAAVGAFVWVLSRQKQDTANQVQEIGRQILEAQKNDPALAFLQREVNSLREQMAKSLADSARLVNDSQKTIGERLDRAAEVVGKVQKSLGSLDQATQQVFAVGKDIAGLQEILRAPKMRGAIGELFLGDLLAQILPPKHFQLQYAFKSGEIVDAAIRLGKWVPVDAKFPLENFKRLLQAQDPQEKTNARRKFVMDVKRHIDTIAAKYILTDEGTYDFALMYIPTESVYYEVIIKDDNVSEDVSIMTYAFSKHVVPVSPNSLYAYLHTISLGLRGMQVEENAKYILEQLDRLKSDFSRFKEDFLLVGKHLSNSKLKYEDAERRLGRFEDKLNLSTQGKESASLPAAESPVPTLPFNN